MRGTFSFSGQSKTSRRAIAVFVVVAAAAWPGVSLASDRFKDVPDNHTFHDDITWLANAGVTLGCNNPVNDRFCPGDSVTRGQMAAFIRRLAQGGVVTPTPLTAGNGLRATGRQISLNPPIRLSRAVSGATPAASSVLSANNTTTDGVGTVGVFGQSNRGSSVSPGAGVNGRGLGGAYGVLGEAGDLTGIASPIGEVGVVGRGQNRGTYGSSQVGIGVYAVSSSNYGVWGQSTTWRGVTGRTGLASNDWGLYTPDNAFALDYHLQGAVMVIVENGGDTALEPGDVVSFSGVTEPTATYEAAMPKVSQSDGAAGMAVAGVVSARFNLDSIAEFDPDTAPRDIETTMAGPVPPGGHLLMVVSGAVRVRVDGGHTGVGAGQPLAASIEPGHAAALADGGAGATGTASIVGTALGPVAGSSDMMWVFVGTG